METVLTCPEWIRDSIARAAASIERAYEGDEPALLLEVEAAQIIGALTDAEELAHAVLVRPALQSRTLTVEKLARVLSPQAAHIAAALRDLGELALPRDWSAAQGLGPQQAETVRKMLLAVVSDPRLVLARLAEHLVQLRHARSRTASERERLALEARAVYAPLANRLGVWQVKWELEDLAFRYLEHAEYRHVASALKERRAEREQYIAFLCETLRAHLSGAHIEAEVYGRPKHIYSIYRKMRAKALAFEELFDVRAVRIIVASVPECYAALGIVHGLWRNVPAQFDDYIASPKQNLYRSIHTAVIGPHDLSVEIQIRTREMHEQAELGVAAHWRYKEGGSLDRQYARKIEWARRLLEPAPAQNAERDFLESLRDELFTDRIYALTPKGEVVDLPRGATPLDFAYHVHTGLGHRCRGAKVNGRIVPLSYTLKNGEIVEIITGREAAPSRDWLARDNSYLMSSRSRAKVRAWFRKLQPSAEPERPEAPVAPLPAAPARSIASGAPRAKGRGRTGIEIEGIGDLPMTLARCCGPTRPQAIMGYVTLVRGVTIHRGDCASLARMRALKPERVLRVEWSAESEAEAAARSSPSR
ncbi:MAG TPA: TGS domain-containing protein [Steroidobacteraceae bacterium]